MTESGWRAGGAPGVASGCPITVGRVRELERLRAVLAPECSRPVGVVSGEPGIGKSRLVDEVLRSPEVGEMVVRRGACHLADQVLPFGPFIDIASRREGLDQLADALATIDHDDAGDERSELQRRRTLDRIARAVLDPDRATVVAIEDVHWSDEVSLMAIAHLARTIAGTHHRILLTHRPGERTPAYARVLADMARHRAVDEIELRPLDADQIGEMATAITGVALTGEQRRALFEISDGNPFHVEELMRTTDGRLDLSDPTVPRPVEHHVVARLADLEPPTRDAVCRAAVIGRDVPIDQLAELMGWGSDETARHAAALVGAGLLKDVDGNRLRFVHELTRRAVESQLLSIERVEIHRRITDVLTREIDAAGPSSIDERTRADLARHAYEGGNWALAIEHGTAAAHAALGRWSATAAIAHLDRVVDASARAGGEPSAETRVVRGRARLHLGDVDGAGDDLRAAARQAEASGDAAVAWQARFELAMLAGQRSHDDAHTCLIDAMAAAERWGEPTAIARTLIRQGNLATNRLECDTAAGLLDRARRLATEAGDDAVVAEAGVLAMVNHSLRGDFRSARRDGAPAVERLRAIDDQVGLIGALFSLSMTGAEHHGDLSRPSATLEQCAAEAEEALARSVALGWSTGEAFSRRGLAGIRSAQGRTAEAIELMRTSISVAETTGHVPQILRGHAVMGEVLLDAADLAGARRHLEQAIEIGERLGAAAALLPSRIRLSEIDIAEGRLEDAAGRLAIVTEGGPYAQRYAVGARAQLLLARGEAGDALELARAAVAALPDDPDDPDGDPPVRLDHLAAEALARLDRLDEATEVLIRADRQARRHGMRLLLRHVVATRATVCARQGDREAARRWGDEAWALADEAARGLEPELDTSLRADMERRTSAVPRTRGPDSGGPAALTPREREVADVVARGLTNQEVADELFISVRTAETHVKRILAKLGFRSRAQIARWVSDQQTD